MRYLAIVSYKGTNYSGWQIQPNDISIQEIIEEKISKILNTPTKIYGSGRTDAGVHALGQTFHFDSDKIKDTGKFMYSLNSLLPDDIYILSIQEVASDFHARYNAKGKIYSYSLNVGKYDLFYKDTIYQLLRPLNIEKIKQCIHMFEGEHCFQNFTSKIEDEDKFVRIIYSLELSSDNDILKLTFKGNGFMRYMIRMLMGTLIEVGLERMNPEDVQKILNDKNRKVVSFKAPANGLCLEKVIY